MDNSQTVLANMEHITSAQRARSIQMFNFSTLYTKIPLEDLKEKLKNNVEKAFRAVNNQYIGVTQLDTKWNHQEMTNTFSKDNIFAMIDLVVDNCARESTDSVSEFLWALTQLLRWLTFTYNTMSWLSWNSLPKKI